MSTVTRDGTLVCWTWSNRMGPRLNALLAGIAAGVREAPPHH